MDHPYLQSTLREMHAILQSSRLWLTFLAVLAIFIVTGPFGTSETMSFAERLLYWTIVQAGAWILAISFSIVANRVFADNIRNMLARMMIGSLTAALPIGLLLTITNRIFSGTEMGFGPFLQSSLSSLPLCAIFCLLSYLTASQSLATAPIAIMGTGKNTGCEVKSTAPLLERLPPQKRGELLRLSVQDHYTEIVTTRGRHLVLLRFSDALKEIGHTEGLQVHRSHWIADADVTLLRKRAGRLHVITKDGTEIPVSRSYSAAVQARFTAHAPAR
ncbi:MULTISPECIES: LytTR family DNA-binding domain-containing protein [Agrobacterium]|uniref:LytTR family DNA-binding domain-containing protein n=1 Tax=Agrobacterium salinitolerans TaxID=1183413 RepID=A0A4Z1RBZ6_9HYPH|nr:MULTISPECIES: LytTR family DNA-binding domain-containing protein [Agrobacterium]MCZ7851345.1 LytTR family DNA-binding domain-containing protein [Agrobacterium salinitolerans]MCZ7856911.1 LytTR family DNA-binding domain-containing protein [Agrobacterium salinitolerans]MCZ7863037.1 LytTR family DNA-binding domain-containing protein [Agrobacterium salinitolerans]MCZ7890247.1 LytTR family DNA-binding domain-containing protein [Agrobacterium salinitolerans]MCZ7973912.1 LytTR family DNA-binding d